MNQTILAAFKATSSELQMKCDPINLLAMASNLLAMASNLIAMAMASNLDPIHL